MQQLIKTFGDQGIAGLVTTLIALVSLAVSLAALISSHRTSRRMVDIEEARDKQASKEASKARFHVALDPAEGDIHELRLINRGDGEARNVCVVVDDLPVNGHPLIFRPQDEKTTLAPGATAKYCFMVVNRMEAPKSIRVEWNDDSGEEGRYETDL